jgi:hypothetical protein
MKSFFPCSNAIGGIQGLRLGKGLRLWLWEWLGLGLPPEGQDKKVRAIEPHLPCVVSMVFAAKF